MLHKHGKGMSIICAPEILIPLEQIFESEMNYPLEKNSVPLSDSSKDHMHYAEVVSCTCMHVYVNLRA